MAGRQPLPSAASYQPLQQSRKPISRLRKGSLRFLVSLSDVQVITGTAILVAGLGQLPRITYYHENFVNNYWLLTLNSFWTAQICNRSSLEKVAEELSISRTLIVFFSVVLAISFQIMTNIREWHHWDFLESGRCYISHDTAGEGQAWLWVVGLILFASSLGLTLVLQSWAWMAVVSTKIDQIWYNVRSKYNNVVGVLVNHLNQKSHSANLHWLQKLSSAIALLAYLIEVACRVFWFLFTQFLSVWICGQSVYGIEVLVYMGFAAWNTYDIIDTKMSNRSLVDGSETKWGFGQILPVGLLAMLVVNAVDAFGLEKSVEWNKKTVAYFNRRWTFRGS